MKRIVIEFVPQHKQRIPGQVGDYGETEHNIWFRITAFPEKPMYSVAILLHEIHEFYRCKQDGVNVEDIDAFDLAHPELDDPGFSPDAPYNRQHREADVLERACLAMAGESWTEYETAIKKLFSKETTCTP